MGPPDGVAKARDLLLEQAKRIENEASVELTIEQKWHRLLIGTKGESIQKIRVKFPEVQVSDGENNIPPPSPLWGILN